MTCTVRIENYIALKHSVSESSQEFDALLTGPFET